MRGKRRIVDTRHNRLRIIPAHAGQTKSKRVRAFSMPDHPRACGANSCDAASGRIVTGSSPRMRGKHGHLVRRNDRDRIIPAHAGQTARPRARRRPPPDHPRACGANCTVEPQYRFSFGSSPRMRGKPGFELDSEVTVRIIPAHAGQTSPAPRRGPRASDHPRACGANVACIFALRSPDGSSPRMRGKPGNGLADLASMRIIPAHAGQTRKSRRGRRPHTDHPRACGANGDIDMHFNQAYGSSPRMRGKQDRNHQHPRNRRIIPAHAGQTW